MSNFVIDPAIIRASHPIAEIDGIYYRLHENALVTWFILLPETKETELFRLPSVQQQSVYAASNAVSQFILQQFSCDKINLACIGNMVSQMHIHVIGRCIDDAYWPDVVWGKPYAKTWTPDQLADIRAQFKTSISVRNC